MAGFKSVLLVAVLVVLVSCDQTLKENDDSQEQKIVRVARQSEVEADVHPAVQEKNEDVSPPKEQFLIRRLKGQEEIDEGHDKIGKINRFKRSPKGIKKGGGVAKGGGGGGCKKGRK